MLGTVQTASYVTDHPIVLKPFAPRPDVKLTAQCVHTVRGLRLHREDESELQDGLIIRD